MTVTPAAEPFVGSDVAPHPFIGSVGLETMVPGGGIDANIRGIQLLERLGYDAHWLSDQTQSWIFRNGWAPDLVAGAAAVPNYEAFFDTIPLLAAMGAATERIKLAVTLDCFRRPPSLLAQSINTLDHISRGRMTIALGTGEDKQFVPYGMERPEPRNTRLEEALRTIRALIRSNEPISMDNRFLPLDDALIGLPPYDPEHPTPVLLAGGGSRPMKIAARSADGISTYLPGGYANQLALWEEDLHTLRTEAENHDRDPDSLVINANFMIAMLCENDDQIARCLASPYTKMTILNLTPTGAYWHQWGSEHPLGDEWMLSVTHRSTKFSRDELLRCFDAVPPELVQQAIYVGTPEDVARRAAPWLAAAGFTEEPLTFHSHLATIILPELLEAAGDGLPRWHHLALRYQREVNRLLGGGGPAPVG